MPEVGRKQVLTPFSVHNPWRVLCPQQGPHVLKCHFPTGPQKDGQAHGLQGFSVQKKAVLIMLRNYAAVSR